VGHPPLEAKHATTGGRGGRKVERKKERERERERDEHNE